MKHYCIGYTAGAFDLFHVGHLNILKNAKSYCDRLIVGVNSNRLINNYKNHEPLIDENDRLSIIKSIRYVDEAFIVESLDKTEVFKNHPFDVVFIGSDWKNSERWMNTEKSLAKLGVDVIYLPHTDGISSSLLKKKIRW